MLNASTTLAGLTDVLSIRANPSGPGATTLDLGASDLRFTGAGLLKTSGGNLTVTASGGSILANAPSNEFIAHVYDTGTLSVGSAAGPAAVTLNGTYLAEVSGLSGADRLTVLGSLALGTGSVLDLNQPGNAFDAATTYTLASYTGGLTGTFGSVASLPGSHFLSYDVALGGGVLAVQLVPVPEPALGLVLAAGGLWAWRRRN